MVPSYCWVIRGDLEKLGRMCYSTFFHPINYYYITFACLAFLGMFQTFHIFRSYSTRIRRWIKLHSNHFHPSFRNTDNILILLRVYLWKEKFSEWSLNMGARLSLASWRRFHTISRPIAACCVRIKLLSCAVFKFVFQQLKLWSWLAVVTCRLPIDLLTF